MSGGETGKIIKIIDAVRKHECLWNVNSSEYAKRDRLERAWNDVAQEVGKSDVFCREKWRNVRTGFLRSVQHQIRINHNESLPNDFNATKRKRFYLYDQMAFLIPSAESLEMARKKRKLSKDRKSVFENDETQSYDNYSDNPVTEYRTVDNFEQQEYNTVDEIHEEEATDDEEVEIEFKTSPKVVNGDDDGGNYEDILKEMENDSQLEQQTHASSHLELTSGSTVQQPQNLEHSPTTKKVISLIGNQLNEETNAKSQLNNNCISSCTTTSLKSNQTNVNLPSMDNIERDEQQLINFFRGCIDDILVLDKRKRRLFKRRMLDLIDELHDS